MPVKISGLPAHVLLIHAVVVLFPLAAIMLVTGAVWPAARRKFGILTPAVALVALALVPVTTHAGEWLRDRLPPSRAIERHAALGDTLLPWAVGMFVVAAGLWLLGRRYELTLRPRPTPPVADEPAGSSGAATSTLTRPVPTRQVLPTWVAVLAAALAIGVSVGGIVQLVRIGDSGATAVWGGVADLPAHGAGG